MFLVFYGHYVEQLFLLEGENGMAMMQYKFIYSFHMPLFFMLSGFFAKRQNDTVRYIKVLISRRIVPVFSFAIMLVPLWLISNKLTTGSFMVKQIACNALKYMGGNPQLDYLTWFLICLFTAELISGVFRLISSSKNLNLLLGVLFVGLGYFVINHSSFLFRYTKIQLNFWYLHESIVALGFYLIGNWVFGIISKLKQNRNWLFYLFVPLISLLLVISNIVFKDQGVVNMASSLHGDFLPFIINSFLGAVLIISIGVLIPANRLMNFIGSNTLIYLGLNGIFFNFVNPYLANRLFLNNSFSFITLNCTLVTLLSLALCYPLIVLINKYLPQLFGKPDSNGPIFKPFEFYIQLFREKAHSILYN